MLSQQTKQHFLSYVAFTDKDFSLFENFAERVEYTKNEWVTKAGNYKSYFYFIEEGFLTSFLIDENLQEHVIQFGKQFWWTGDLNAITSETISNYNIRAMLPSIVWRLTKQNLYKLLDSSARFERFFRIIFQNSLISHQNRLIRKTTLSAEQRYLLLLQAYPTINQLVAQKHIANYLGITPEFLSKMKKRLL